MYVEVVLPDAVNHTYYNNIMMSSGIQNVLFSQILLFSLAARSCDDPTFSYFRTTKIIIKKS